MRKTDGFETLTYFHRENREKQREMRAEVMEYCSVRDVVQNRSRIRISTGNIFVSVIWTRVTGEASRHGLFPREPPVVKGMHVNHLLCFDDGGRLGFLFPPPLAFQRHPELLHHHAAERALRTEEQNTDTCWFPFSPSLF